MSGDYTRLYHRFVTEFDEIYADDRAFATWVRLLLLADASWPMRAPLPRSVRKKQLDQLASASLIEVQGDTFTVRGLDAERVRRRNAARVGAAKRWQSDGIANADAVAMPRRDETRRDKPSRDSPPPPAERGRRKNTTNPRSTGAAPRQRGTNPRENGTSTRQVRTDQKRGSTALGSVLRKAATIEPTAEGAEPTSAEIDDLAALR